MVPVLPAPLQPASLDFPLFYLSTAAPPASSLPSLPQLCASMDERIKMSSSFKSGDKVSKQGVVPGKGQD